MKKIIASILGLSMVFTAAIAVSAAPTVSGEVVYKANFENKTPADKNLLEGKVNFGGQLDSKTDYKLTLKKGDSLMTEPIMIDEASFTHKFDAATVQAGFFGYNPTVMDIMDNSTKEMKAPFAVKVMPNLGENLKVAVGVLPRENDSATLGDWAYQLEADYVMDTVSLGVNYQNDRIAGNDAGLTFQVTAQPVKNVQVYGEFGQATGGADVSKIGGVYSNEKISLRGEYDMEDGNNWAAKAGYKFTSNISGEFETNKAEAHQARLKYTF